MDKYMKFFSHICSPTPHTLPPAHNSKADDVVGMPACVRTWLKTAAVLCTVLLSSPAPAQSAAVTTVTGSITATGSGTAQVTFSCTGVNPCIGTYNVVSRDTGCSNSFSAVDVITITGLDLTRPGPIKGNVIFTNGKSSDTRNPDGTCSIKPDSFKDIALTFDGTWTGTNGSLSFPTQINGDGSTTVLTGSFSATTAVPIQPIPVTTVNGSINATGVGGDSAQFTFACKGANPCTGT